MWSTGTPSFLDEKTIEVTSSEGIRERIGGDYFVIAVGTRPYRPPDIDFSHPRVLDSDKVLELEDTPGSITIYGAGVIGCEYASVFRNLGCKLDLINTRDKLLSFLDDEIIDALSYHLRDQGTIIRHNESYERVEPRENEVMLHLTSGKKVRSDYLLWAQGRTGNTDGLGLENINVEVNSRKQLDVNEDYQTDRDHIYAVGDVVGFPGLASAGYDQGTICRDSYRQGKDASAALSSISRRGFIPAPRSAASARPSANSLSSRCPTKWVTRCFRSLARAQIVNCPVGMLKILFHRENYQILGIHCFGYQAAEILHIGQAIMSAEGRRE